MTTHELKTWPMHFTNVYTGIKRVELRLDDRDYQQGDVLVLKEWDPQSQSYTDRECRRRVTHLMRGGAFGLQDGYVAMSLGSVPDLPVCGLHGERPCECDEIEHG